MIQITTKIRKIIILLPILLLLFSHNNIIVLVSADKNSNNNNNKGKLNSYKNNDDRRFEQSRVWPAIREIENYGSSSDSTNNENIDKSYNNNETMTTDTIPTKPPTPKSLILRTFHSTIWTFQYNRDPTITSDDDDDNEYITIIEYAKKRFQKFLQNGIPSNAYEKIINPYNNTLYAIQGIQIHINKPNETILYHGINEEYGISLLSNSTFIHIYADNVFGALYGIETIKQLLQFGWIVDNNNAIYTLPNVNEIRIIDSPMYKYRGLMIDTARHYLPISLIINNLNIMATNKLNILHWHITDRETFPFQSKKFPELSQYGSYCNYCTYNRTNIEYIIQQAKLRGIRVIIEIDLPGHSKVIGNAHPDYLSSCNKDGTEFGEPLDVTKSSVVNLTKELYNEITEIFPDEFIHVGGDEVDLSCWSKSGMFNDIVGENNTYASINDIMSEYELDLIDTVENIHQRTVIGWQELLETNNMNTLPKTVILDVWKSWVAMSSVSMVATAGYHFIYSACWYLDYLNQKWIDFHKCNPKQYLRPEQYKLLLGGHACMWGEHVDETNFFSRVYPRTSAMAEVLWTGSPLVYARLNQTLISDRLDKFTCYMARQYKVPIEPIRPGYCDRGYMGGNHQQ